MIVSKIYFLILLTFWNINDLNSLRSLDTRWKYINCSIVAKSYFGIFNCFINERPRNRGNYITAQLQFKQNIKTILLHFRISMAMEGKKEAEFINFHCDGCQISKRRLTNPVITTFTRQFLKSGNFTRECPLEANITYTLEKLYISPEYFPEFTPDMTASFKITMFTNQIHLLSVHAVAGALNKK